MCELTGLRNSAKAVVVKLEYEGPMTYSEIGDELAMPDSTLDDALECLREEGAVRKVYEDDARSPKYAPVE